MALGVGAARDGEAQQFQRGVMPLACFRVEAGKHDRADFHAANAAFAVQFHSQSLRREFIIGNVREDRARIDVHTMSASGLEGGNACFVEFRSEIGSLPDAIRKILFIQAFVQADCHRVEVAASESAVGGEAFTQDQLVLYVLE